MTAGPAAQHALSITIERTARRTVRVHVQGEIDLATAPQLQVALLAEVNETALATEIAVDLTGVRFMDAVGIGMLVEVRNAARQAGLGFSVHNPQPIVMRVVYLLGLAEVLRVSTAVAHAAPPPWHRNGDGPGR